jgi:hypothetical protein
VPAARHRVRLHRSTDRLRSQRRARAEAQVLDDAAVRRLHAAAGKPAVHVAALQRLDRNDRAIDGFPFCPLARSIPPTTEYFYDDCHFNENGARKVASLLADCLLQDKAALATR